MRFECVDFPGSFVEYSDVWSRREVNQSFRIGDSELIDFARAKTTAINLERVGMEPLTDVADITDDGLGDVRWELFAWWRFTVLAAASELGRLGEASGRRLLQRRAASADQPNASPTPI
jgi:hypothetical protein